MSKGAAAKRTSWRRISLLEDDLEEHDALSRGNINRPEPGSPAAFRASIGGALPATRAAPPPAPAADDGLVWGDPPPKARGKGRVAVQPPWLELLKANPGRWALVIPHHRTNTIVYKLKKQWGVEATARGTKAAGWAIYARVPISPE